MRLRFAILAAALLASTAAFAQDEMLTPENPSESCPQFFYHGISPVMLIPMEPYIFKSLAMCKHGYALGVSFPLTNRSTLWSAEHLTPALVEAAEKNPIKPGLDDKLRSWMKRWEKQGFKDYIKDSRYEIRPLAPAGDFADVDLQKETFSINNTVRLNKEFNRYLWNKIEEKVREIAKKYPDTYVVTGALFEGSSYIHHIPEGLETPIYMWKSVYVPGHMHRMYIASNDEFPLCMIIPDEVLAKLSGVILRPEFITAPSPKDIQSVNKIRFKIEDIPSVPEIPFKMMDDGQVGYPGCHEIKE